MSTQKFYCPENGLLSGEIKEIEIPGFCPECGNQLIISSEPFGNLFMASGFENICDHFSTYPLVWAQRILPVILEYGVNCSKCNNFYPYAIRTDNFVCYGCRIGF